MRIGKTKRKAIVILFMDGMDFRQIGRLFTLKKRDVEDVVRQFSRVNGHRR